MGKNSFKLFTDYAEIFDNLSDEQAGQLIKAIFAHETGQEYSLDGLLNAVFVPIRQQLDRNRESYNTICEKNRQNIQKRWDNNTTVSVGIRPYDSVSANDTKNTDTDKDKDTDTDKDTDKNNKPQNARAREGDIFAGRSFSPKMQDKLTEWLKYKAERRESYKPMGLKSFLSEVENKLKQHSEADVIALINECMANNWKGIIWDKIKSRASPSQLSASTRYAGVSEII
jgi:hypothetical protein